MQIINKVRVCLVQLYFYTIVAPFYYFAANIWRCISPVVLHSLTSILYVTKPSFG